jgi:pimeloyl-ACP methyl ester carboxylesterase
LKLLTLITIGFFIFLLGWWLWTPDEDRASLERNYLRAPEDMVEVAGIKLHVRDSGPTGNAPTVIFLHGFGASLHTWEPWASILSRDMRVIRLDLPGSGLSSPDPTGNYGDARTLEVLLALMRRLGVARASLAGNSIGGRIAWTFAAQHPERIEKLVLISPDGFASPGFEYGKKPQVPATVKLMQYALPKSLLRMSLVPAYANPVVLTDELTARYHDLMLGPGSRGAMIARLEQTVLVDPVPMLKKITAPTLLLWGEQDALIPFSNSADYMKAIPRVTLVSLPGIGHLPHEEAPEKTIGPVRAFLIERRSLE